MQNIESGSKSQRTLTNHQTTLADKAGAAYARYRKLDREAIAAYLESGAHLREANAGCKHGEFGAVLDRAGIPRTVAYRAMRLSAARLKCATVAQMGGVRRADEAHAIVKDLPDPRRALAALIRIKRATDRVHSIAGNVIEGWIEKGRRLAEAKAALRTGEWINVHEHPRGWPWKQRTSDALIAIADSGLSVSELAGMMVNEPFAETPEAMAREVHKRAA